MARSPLKSVKGDDEVHSDTWERLLAPLASLGRSATVALTA
jgi:hypothetical protein